MTQIRIVFGGLAGAFATLAAVLALHGAFINVKLALELGSPTLILLGLVAPIILGVVAWVLYRLAYRRLFWRRYLAARVQAHAPSPAAPPSKQ